MLNYFKSPEARKQAMRAFHLMVEGLSSQGWKRSVNDRASCRYLALKDGKRHSCAIGWLVPGEHIDELAACEGYAIGSLEHMAQSRGDSSGLIVLEVIEEEYPLVPRDFLRMLQALHDYSDRTPRQLAQAFRDIDMMFFDSSLPAYKFHVED